jgi:hypothetical protein
VKRGRAITLYRRAASGGRMICVIMASLIGNRKVKVKDGGQLVG